MDENSKKYNSSSVNEAPKDSIGVIHITGPMIKYGNYYCWGADELVAQAQLFDKNPNIKGIVFIIDTGGGAVNAVAPYLDFLKNKTKPVVAWCDMCASAGYWVASGCDYIMAANTISSSFGSIGVMVTLRDASKYWKDLGVEDHVINADPSEHKNKTFELALKGDYKLIKKELLNPLAVQFQETVKANRPNLKLDVEGIISGKMFFAQDSVDIGLADGIGNLQQAMDKVTELKAVQTIMYN
ncbi:S49 family peptidase [Tenacibaculum soleae]|uniref:S49 family peptidase n=1 Tax=Tenacibaculum soleae TaxID=447689 RepID=UPI0023016145|nr:S49 family peptidase [Tenacibaculum soleae]